MSRIYLLFFFIAALFLYLLAIFHIENYFKTIEDQRQMYKMQVFLNDISIVLEKTHGFDNELIKLELKNKIKEQTPYSLQIDESAIPNTCTIHVETHYFSAYLNKVIFLRLCK